MPSSVKVLGKGLDTLSAQQRKRREEIPNKAKYAKSKKLNSNVVNVNKIMRRVVNLNKIYVNLLLYFFH